MAKYLLFTDDDGLRERLKLIFNKGQLEIRDKINLSEGVEYFDLIIIDESFIRISNYLKNKEFITNHGKPIVYLIEKMKDEVIALLDSGVISIILKDTKSDLIKRKIEKIIYNYKYLNKLKLESKLSKKTEKFFELFNSITSDNTINDIMINILNSIKETFDFSSIYFFFITNRIMKHKVSLGRIEKKITKIKWNLDRKKTFEKLLIKRKKPFYVNQKTNKVIINAFGIGKVMMPLIIKDKFIGLIIADLGSNIEKIDKQDIKLLKAYCDQTSVVLENAQLYWSVITTREELVEQEKKNLLGQMIISLNHEINNPLSIISMEAQMLQKKFENKEVKIESRIENIENNIDRIKTILEKISSLNVSDDIAVEYIKGQQMLNLKLDN